MKKNEIEDIKKLILKAGKLALELRDKGLEIEVKEDNSPVTNADIVLSEMIAKGLENIFPEIAQICEEGDKNIELTESFWLIDPIDGTRSFIEGKPTFTVNIALIEGDAPKYGFIYAPATDFLYYVDHEGEMQIERNGVKMPRAKHDLEGLVATVSSHRLSSNAEEFIKKYNFEEVIPVPSSIKLCFIAEGRADIYPRFGTTMEWDIAAGHALINASGGELCDSQGNELSYRKPDFKNSDFYAKSSKWLGFRHYE